MKSKQIILIASAIGFLVISMSSCAARKNRKCDGKKGQKTPMGLI